MDNETLLLLPDVNDTTVPSGTSSPFNEGQMPILSDTVELQMYLRVTCLIFLSLIFVVGTIGNVMVMMVISCARDMRTSTNIFLVNLSIADLLVVVICTPTALIEVTHHPERWILGFYLCKFIPLLEATVANASVLTILAISFERYYAICQPLKANYVCTKSRAVWISVAAWVLAFFITSPMILMITYQEGVNDNGEWTARCNVRFGETWPDVYTISTIILFFLLPIFILLVTYGMIANKLTMDRTSLNAKNENHKARKQVVTMLGTVVFTFFLCLLPFRVLTLVVLGNHNVFDEHTDAFHNFVYFSRIMLYWNSCLNPILYNVMSSKFRNGFLRLCNRQRKQSRFTRTGTFLTNTTTNSTNVSINLGHQAGLAITGNGKGSGQNSPELNGSIMKRNGVTKVDGKTLKSYLLSQSHSSHNSNGFLLMNSSHHTREYYSPSSGHSYYHFHELPTSSSLRATNVKLHNHLNSSIPRVPGAPSANNNYTNGSYNGGNAGGGGGSSGTGSGGSLGVKSDLIYSAYIPGKRCETVL